MTTKTLERTTSESPAGAVRESGTPSTWDEARFLVPPVDIYEDGSGLVVMVDLPGVARDGVDVSVENDELRIEGRTAYRQPGNLVYSEFDLTSYRRQFRLGEHFDREKISAELKHGVLTVRLPKAERAKPRRIDVSVT